MYLTQYIMLKLMCNVVLIIDCVYLKKLDII
jgi:hypothetical protein